MKKQRPGPRNLFVAWVFVCANLAGCWAITGINDLEIRDPPAANDSGASQNESGTMMDTGGLSEVFSAQETSSEHVTDAGPSAEASTIDDATSEKAADTGLPDVASTGLLTGTVTSRAPSVDLTKEGLVDWAHWGLAMISDHNRKSLSVPLIGNLLPFGSGVFQRYNDDMTTFVWNDGVPTASASTTAGIYIDGAGKGVSLTVAADAEPRTLRLFVQVYAGRGRLQAALSDLSAPSYQDDSVDNQSYTTKYAVYSLRFRARSSGQSLSVNWFLLNDLTNGNVAIAAATLQL